LRLRSGDRGGALEGHLVPLPTLVRTAIFFPVTMSLIAVGLMFLLILNPNFGALNAALRALGLSFLIREWFGDYQVALYTLALVSGYRHRPATGRVRHPFAAQDEGFSHLQGHRQFEGGSAPARA
jgi:hypothetical protein